MVDDICDLAQLAVLNGCPKDQAARYGEAALEHDDRGAYLMGKPWAETKPGKKQK